MADSNRFQVRRRLVSAKDHIVESEKHLIIVYDMFEGHKSNTQEIIQVWIETLDAVEQSICTLLGSV